MTQLNPLDSPERRLRHLPAHGKAAVPPATRLGRKWANQVDRRASQKLSLPVCLQDLGQQRAHEILQAEVDRQEAEARAFVKAQGWKVMGKVAVQNISPYKHARSCEEIGKLVPHVAAGRGQKQARLDAIAELFEFRRAYRAALERWRNGDRATVFPAGTYAMRVLHQVTVDSFARRARRDDESLGPRGSRAAVRPPAEKGSCE